MITYECFLSSSVERFCMTPKPASPDEPDLTSVPTIASASGADAAHGFGPYHFLRRLGEGI